MKHIVPQDVKMPDTGTGQEFSVHYRRYQELGGIINENDHRSALERARRLKTLYRGDPTVLQVVGIAKYAGIELGSSKDVLDPRVVLYAILRRDARPNDAKYHHSQMCDQRIFGEVLRMLGDADSMEKLIKACPNISFQYEKEE